MKFSNREMNFEELVDKTVCFIRKYNISINEITNEMSNLCVDLFGTSNKNDVLHLKTIWERNQNDFATRITSAINNPGSVSLSIELNENEYFEIQGLISKGERKKLLAEFDFFLNNKLKSQLDFRPKCFLKSKYNWFVNSKRIYNQTSQSNKIWKGMFYLFLKRF